MAADPRTADLELARRRVKRAGGLLREAARDLARATSDGAAIIASMAVVDADGEREAAELIRLARSRYGGEVELIVTERLRRDTPHSGTPDRRGDPR